MLDTLRKSAQAYHELYRDKELLVKVSGAELVEPAFSHLAKAIHTLTRDGIRIILAYGGGEQIDRKWQERHTSERPKKGGMGLTTEEVLHDAVLPAAADIRLQLEREFKMMHILDPRTIQCIPLRQFGHVGEVRHIELGNPRPLTAVGFVGTAKGREVNVNADDIALQLVRQYQQRIHEVFFLTKPGGIRDRSEALVSLINEHGVKQIIQHEHPTIEVDGGMQKKILVLRKLLPRTGKVAMTNAQNFLKEIEDWRGSGTLFYHTSFLQHSPILPTREGDIFHDMYQTNVRERRFRARAPSELEQLIEHHFMLRAKDSPIGGFSLVPHKDDWHEISALWSGYIGNGVGDFLLKAAKEQAETQGRAETSTKLFSLSTEPHLIDLFRRAGFTHIGQVSAIRTRRDVALPKYVRRYAVDGRDPHVFVYREHLGVAVE